MNFKLNIKANFIPELKVSCSPLLKFLPSTFHAGREMVWTIGPVIEYEVQSAIVPFIGIITGNKYELRQQCHFICISSRRVKLTN
jgi:hypothetical protein